MAKDESRNTQDARDNGYVRDLNPTRKPDWSLRSVLALVSLTTLPVIAVMVFWVLADQPSDTEAVVQLAELLEKIEQLQRAESPPEGAEAQTHQVSDDERIRELFARVERLEKALQTAADPGAERVDERPVEARPNATLNREQVQAGFKAVAEQVKRCGMGQKGTVTVQVIIDASGEVSSAEAVGSFRGTELGACAARAVRAAQFPPSNRSLTVRFPFHVGT